MKKTAKSILLVTILAIVLLALTGCGGDKLVATKSSDLGEEKVEISLKDDKIKEIEWTITCEDKDDAKEGAEVFEELAKDTEGMKVKQSGKKVVLTMDAKAFSTFAGADISDESISKDDLKKMFEEMDYEVK